MNGLIVWLMAPWAERLGWTLVHFLWQGAAIAAALAVVRIVTADPRLRHAAACAALAAMAAAPVLTFVWLGAGSAELLPAAAAVVAAPASDRIGAVQPPAPDVLRWLVMVWLAGVAVFSMRLACGWVSAMRVRYAGTRPAPREWQRRMDGLAKAIGVARRVRLLVSPRVDVPAVLGWLRPVVLAPVGAFAGLPVEHVEALLAHELAHIQRNDYLINVLQGVVEAVLFYHPAVWWVSKQIRTERELCCDDVAVAASGDVLTYARALAELETCRRLQAGAAVAADGGSLVQRIARLVEPRPSAAQGPGAVWALGVLLMLGIGGLAIHAEQDTPRGEYPTVVRDSIWVDTVKSGDLALEVRALGRLTSATSVELAVAEAVVQHVKLGQAVKMDFGNSTRLVEGRVLRIRPQAQDGTVAVDVQVEAIPASVAQAAAQVDATIHVGALANVVYVGRPATGKADQEVFLFRVEPDGKQAVRTKVMLGRASVNQIEIRSGLQPGERVIVSDMSKYKDAERVNLK
jgi:beta-lactamase regulating signal transducer with metallopeptidase domain